MVYTSLDQTHAKNYHPSLIMQARHSAKSASPVQYLQDIAVLFAEAATLNGHFQTRALDFASDSGTHNRCYVKRRRRAIQKMFRSYGGNAGRLIDLVRSSITFDSIDGQFLTNFEV